MIDLKEKIAPLVEKLAIRLLGVLGCLLLACGLLFGMLLAVGNPGRKSQTKATGAEIMTKYDMYMTNLVSDAMEGVLSIEKVYWLNDDDLVAPEPDPEAFGEAAKAEELQWLLEDAAELLEGQETYFSTETRLLWGSKIRYYLDETIFVATWKEHHGDCGYTFSEIKIKDASQFRRFLAGGEYGSDKQFVTTEMAESVNAVVASSGDFYRFRNYGTIVYDGTVERINSKLIDTCFIDDKGDLHLIPRNTITELEDAQKYVDENNIRFSVAFGPILIDNFERCEPYYYTLGEINDLYPRAALCQMGERHYLLVTANDEFTYKQIANDVEEEENLERGYKNTPDIHQFTRVLMRTGCEKAYALDGGQTAVIAMNGQTVNRVLFDAQRKISDIIYFATAIPNGG